MPRLVEYTRAGRQRAAFMRWREMRLLAVDGVRFGFSISSRRKPHAHRRSAGSVFVFILGNCMRLQEVEVNRIAKVISPV